MDIAAKAEQDLNSPEAKTGVQEGTGFGGKDEYKGASDSGEIPCLPPKSWGDTDYQYLIAREGGIDQSVTEKFPGSTAEYTSREIPDEEGGGRQRGTGKQTKQADFDQGEAGEGPDDIAKQRAQNYGGDMDVKDSLRGVNAEKNESRIDK